MSVNSYREHGKTEEKTSLAENGQVENMPAVTKKSFFQRMVSWKTAALVFSCVSLGAALVSAILGYKIIYEMNEVMDEVEEEVALPAHMQDLSWSDKRILVEDSYAHNWGKYNEQNINNIQSLSLGHTNYLRTSNVWLVIQDVEAPWVEGWLASTTRLARNDNVYWGTVEIGVEFSNVARSKIFVSQYEMYQIIGEHTSDVYIKIKDSWYHARVDNKQDSVLNITPDDCVAWFSQEISKAEPNNRGVSLPSHTLTEIYPYSLFKPLYCENSLLCDDVLTLDDGRVDSVMRGESVLPVDWDKLSRRMDSTLVQIVDMYHITEGGALISFDKYDSIKEIVVPEEVLAAEELTEEVEQMWGVEIVEYVSGVMRDMKKEWLHEND